MTQDSFLRSQSGRMSPVALALAVALHLGAAAALWWTSPLDRDDHAQTPIMVSLEPQPLSGGGTTAPAVTEAQDDAVAAASPEFQHPSPPEIEPAAQEQSAVPMAPAPPAIPASDPPLLTAEQPPPPQPEPAPPDPRPLEAESSPAKLLPLPPVPDQSATSPPDAESQLAWPADVSRWRPQVTFDQALSEAPPPKVSDVQRLQRPPTARPPVQRAQPAAPPAPRAALPAHTSAALSDSIGTTVDSLQGHGGARNDYLSRVFRHIEPFRSYPEAARASRQRGRVVTRVTINRLGELVDIRVDRTSGWPLIDRAELAAIQRAMPLPPVPAGMPGDPIVLILPMTYGDEPR